MSTYTSQELQEILDKHSLWLQGNSQGVRANLSGVSLSGADLSRANLREANLSRANLYRTDLSEANLYGANLSRANLSRADLSGANLYKASLYGTDLSRVNLSGASLYGTSLSGANLSGADLSGTALSYPIYQAYLGQYYIHTNAEYIRIGCEYRTVQDWLQVTQEQAIVMGLDSGHYKNYMAFIKWYSLQPISKGINK